MKNIFWVLAMVITTSACHKKQDNTVTSTPAVVNPKIKNLTSVRYLYKFSGANRIYITWNFSGGDTISAMPSQDTIYNGRQFAFFNGTDIVRIQSTNYHMDSATSSLIPGHVIILSYKSPGIIDTLTCTYTYPSYGTLEKAVFQYSGNHISKVIVGKAYSGSTDINWAYADSYTYTYDGDNISQIYYEYGGGYTNTYKYLLSSKPNNLAGSLAMYTLVACIRPKISSHYFLLNMPLYTNANCVDAIQSGSNDNNTFITITDTYGKTSALVQYANTVQTDTTFFYY